MIQFGPVLYLLAAHRGKPASERAEFWARRITYQDTIEIAEMQRSDLPEEERPKWLVAHQLVSCDSFGDASGPIPYPGGGTMAERMAWVGRLPPEWLTELVRRFQREPEIDPEEE